MFNEMNEIWKSSNSGQYAQTVQYTSHILMKSLHSHILANISDPKFPTILPQQPNLSSSERSALHSLHTNSNILILFADKGSCTVILDKSDYLTRLSANCPIGPYTSP